MSLTPSEIFKQLVLAFPTPRGVRDACQVCRVRVFEFAGYGFFEVPVQLPSPAGGVRDACPVCRVRVRCLACFRGFGNVQRRVLTLPSPRKPSNNLFRPFRPLGNLQATCLSLSDASETFKQLVSAFPTPRGVRDARQVCRVRAFEVPGQLPSPGRGRQGRQPSLPGTGFWGYPASFPAPAGAVRDVCQVCRVRVF